MKAKDLVICIREDNYCIDTLTLVKHPKINDIVEVEKVVKDEEGIWLWIVGYDVDMFDANCFRRITLQDINNLIKEKTEILC